MGLTQGARKSVKDKTTAAVQAAAALPHHLPHGRVRHEIATAHIFEGCALGGAQVALGAAFRGAKNVASGKVAGTETPVEQVSLGTFAHAWSAKKDEPPRARRGFRLRFAPGSRPLQPNGTVGFGFRSHAEQFAGIWHRLQ